MWKQSLAILTVVVALAGCNSDPRKDYVGFWEHPDSGKVLEVVALSSGDYRLVPSNAAPSELDDLSASQDVEVKKFVDRLNAAKGDTTPSEFVGHVTADFWDRVSVGSLQLSGDKVLMVEPVFGDVFVVELTNDKSTLLSPGMRDALRRVDRQRATREGRRLFEDD